MVETVIRVDEVNLDSVQFKLDGPVTITLPEAFGEKIVLGDFTQAGHRRRNVIRWRDFTGGVGLELISLADREIELNRCWWSNCYLFEPGHSTLPSKQNQLTGEPSGSFDAFQLFGGQLYVVGNSDGSIFRTTASSDNLSDTTHNLTNSTVDSVAGRLGGTDYIIWGQDGSGYEFASDGASYTTGGREGHFLEIWDDRLWGFDVDDNQLWYSFTPTATAGDHTNDAILPVEIGEALDLFVGPDASGNEILYVLAVNGLWAHDAANARFVQTNIRLVNPIKRDSTEAPINYHLRCTTCRGRIYLPYGSNIIE